MSAAFTKGPWAVVAGTVIRANDEKDIGRTFETSETDVEFWETRANAHLIAAAPDLYAALFDAAKIINGMHRGTLPECFAPTQEMIDRMNAALAKVAE